MKRLLSCEFNMDTACVELKFANGSMIAIDTIAVENEVADKEAADGAFIHINPKCQFSLGHLAFSHYINDSFPNIGG